MDITTRRITTAPDVELDVVDVGSPEGPVVVLAHGFPESATSWRHQLGALTGAGYRVLAPHQRGYATSSAPRAVDAYRADLLSADLLALLDDVGVDDALFVGHDWGALLLWDLARIHPDRVRGLVNVSVPYNPWPAPPTTVFRDLYGDRFFYILYFQEVGPAEAELERDVRTTMHHVLWAGSGDLHGPSPTELPPMEGTGFIEMMTSGRDVPPLDVLPPWLAQTDFDAYVEQFTASGFFGPISWYRNLDANYKLTSTHPRPPVPTAFIGGRRDGVIAHRLELVDAMEAILPDFRGAVLIDGAGHWTQQERPHEFNAALLDLLERVSPEPVSGAAGPTR